MASVEDPVVVFGPFNVTGEPGNRGARIVDTGFDDGNPAHRYQLQESFGASKWEYVPTDFCQESMKVALVALALGVEELPIEQRLDKKEYKDPHSYKHDEGIWFIPKVYK